MTIRHQTVLGEDGTPSAALVPWDEFQRIRALLDDEEPNELSDEWREELHRRVREIDEGEVELVDGDDFLRRLRAL